MKRNIIKLLLLLWIILIVFITLKDTLHQQGNTWNFNNFLTSLWGNRFSFEKINVEEYRNIFLFFGGIVAYLGFLISKEKEDRESLQLEEAKKLQRKSDFREYIEYCADTTNELKRVAGFTGLFSILNESKEENYLYQIMEVVRSYLTTSRSGDQLVEKKIFSELDELLSYRPTSSTIESLEDRIDSIDSTISKLEKFSTTHLKILSLLFNSLIYVLNKIKNLMIPLKEILEERKIKNDPYFALNNYTTLDLSGITVSIPLKMELKYGKIDFSRSTFLENVKLSRSSKTYSIRSIIDEETIIINEAYSKVLPAA